jgi:hypothetical protein
VKQNREIEIGQLLTPAEAGRLKGMDRELARYHLKRPGAPTPVLVGVYKHTFYLMQDVEAWEPNREASRHKTAPRGGGGEK